MRLAWVTWLTPLVVCASALAARADDLGPFGEVYPHEQTARPLVLPSGGLEGTASITDQHVGIAGEAIDTWSNVLGARLGGRGVELEAALEIFLDQAGTIAGLAPPAPDRLAGGSLAARLELSRDATFGLELRYLNPGANGAFVLKRKLHPSRRAAIVMSARVGGDTSGSEQNFSLFQIAGELRVQAQVRRRLMIEAGGTLGYNKVIGNDVEIMSVVQSTLVHTAGVRMVIGLSCAIDLGFAVEILQSSSIDSQLFTISLIGRRIH
jgi:hypothetical protein